MVGLSSTPTKSKGKKLVVISEKSDADRSPGLQDALIEPEGVYQHAWTRMGAIAPVDYNLLVRKIEVNDEHSAIIESQSLNSSLGTTAFVSWRELLSRWPSDSKSRPEFNGSKLI